MSHLLFVYGTLKKGKENNFRLEDEEFLGSCLTKPFYDLELIEKGSPNITKGKNAVKGELYNVSFEKLKELDKYEKPYIRDEIELKDGTRAQVYRHTK